ncbi:acyltransferase [Microbacterium sp. CCNWLW134]|uniref:acyltransferase family protein n=1 Tax=Microbacterium sp. CCNWLW134 TaxID=3122064 RepID=UPI00300FBEEF
MPALDGLRAVAVGLVFAIHAFPDAGFPGGLGVDVFFVISGFLITRILLKQWRRDDRISLRTFYFSRLVRLYPPLIVVVAVFFFIPPIVGAAPGFATGGTLVALTYTSNIVMTLVDPSLGYLSHTWSLAMEEQFYLFWPLLLIAMLSLRWTPARMAIVTGGFALVSMIGWVLTGDDLPYNPLTKAGGLLLGCVLAMVHEHGRTWMANQWAAWVGMAVFAVAFGLETGGIIERSLSMPIATVGMLPVIAHAAFGRGPIVTALSWRPVVYLGVISYGLYLWHYPILWVMARVIEAPQWLTAIVAALLTAGLSMLTNVLVEKPSLRWRDRVVKRYAWFATPARESLSR